MSDPIKIDLSKPIVVIGEERTSLTLREPTGAMLARAGSYIRVVQRDDGDTAIEPIPGGMNKLIAASAGIPVSSVEMMSMRDINAAQLAVMSFLSEPATTS